MIYLSRMVVLNSSYSFLQKWLEVSSRRHSGPPCCELCQYQYLRHKKFVVSVMHITSFSKKCYF